MRPTLSVIVPIYNEVSRLLDGFGEITKYLNKNFPSSELILVDDGSTLSPEHILMTSTHKRTIKPMMKQKRLRFLTLPVNQGKGAAIAYGVQEARGKYVVFTDIDCSVPMPFLPDLLYALKSHDIAIGSRRLVDSVIVVHQPWLREGAGRVFTIITNAICNLRVSDVTCGFKGFRLPVAQYLFSKHRIDRWSFDAEILFLARTSGYSIAQVPVAWSNKTGSRVKLTDTIKSFIDVLNIRVNDVMGKYT